MVSLGVGAELWLRLDVHLCAGDVGFHKGRPLAAMVIFRCCLQWKAFQADRTSLFDKIINTMGSQVRLRLRLLVAPG